jgi:predicted metal-dependent HD superfamily phosphohydrolase
VQALAPHPAEVEMALWFHDAIYDVHRHDNEEQSAQWAREALEAAGVAAEVAARIEQLVLATQHTAIPHGADACLLVDIDLGILGAEKARFAEYERQIRAEYAHVPEPLFSQRRRAILRSFLERPAIYGTEPFRAALEERARCNLARSIEAIDASNAFDACNVSNASDACRAPAPSDGRRGLPQNR